MITKLRLISQITILAGVLCLSYLNHYENQKAKYGGHLVIKDSAVLSAIDRAVGHWENRSRWTRFMQGDVWAAQIGKMKVVDPLGFVGNLARTRKVHARLFMASLIPIAATVLFGKIFCSWICPMGLLFEVNSRLRGFLVKKGVPLFNAKAPGWLKYGVLAAGLVMGLLSGAHFFFIVYPPKIISGEVYFWVTRSAFSYGMAFILCYLAIELLFAPRIWCRSLCPGGALYTLLGRFRWVRIKNDLKSCTDCGICDRLCPYQVNPSQGHLSMECDHCSLCVDQCPVHSLSFGFGFDDGQHALAMKETLKRSFQAVKNIVIFLAVTGGLFVAADVRAHHIRGLPHYGYSDNYPQTPTYEELRTVGRWEISFSFIRIFETKYCDLAVYIKNTQTGKPYQGMVTFKVFGGGERPEDAHAFNALMDPTNTYRAQWVYEDDGIYTMRIRFSEEGKEYVEDFKMQMGEAVFSTLWLILPGLFVLALVFLNVFARLKKQ